VQDSVQDIVISPIIHPVAVLRQKDRLLAMLSFNLTQHSTVLAELEMNLHTFRAATDQSTSIGETRQLEVELRYLKEKLANIQRFLPRPTRKMALLNIAERFQNHFLALRPW
jgi:hypothetical protein